MIHIMFVCHSTSFLPTPAADQNLPSFEHAAASNHYHFSKQRVASRIDGSKLIKFIQEQIPKQKEINMSLIIPKHKTLSTKSFYSQNNKTMLVCKITIKNNKKQTANKYEYFAWPPDRSHIG